MPEYSIRLSTVHSPINDLRNTNCIFAPNEGIFLPVLRRACPRTLQERCLMLEQRAPWRCNDGENEVCAPLLPKRYGFVGTRSKNRQSLIVSIACKVIVDSSQLTQALTDDQIPAPQPPRFRPKWTGNEQQKQSLPQKPMVQGKRLPPTSHGRSD